MVQVVHKKEGGKVQISDDIIKKLIKDGKFKDVTPNKTTSYRKISGHKKAFEANDEAVYALEQRLFADSIRSLEKALKSAGYSSKAVLAKDNILTSSNYKTSEMQKRVKKIVEYNDSLKEEIPDAMNPKVITAQKIRVLYSYYEGLMEKGKGKKEKKSTKDKKSKKDSEKTKKKDKKSLAVAIEKVLEDPKKDGKQVFAVVDGNDGEITRRTSAPKSDDFILKNGPVLFRNFEDVDAVRKYLKKENKNTESDVITEALDNKHYVASGDKYNSEMYSSAEKPSKKVKSEDEEEKPKKKGKKSKKEETSSDEEQEKEEDEEEEEKPKKKTKKSKKEETSSEEEEESDNDQEDEEEETDKEDDDESGNDDNSSQKQTSNNASGRSSRATSRPTSASNSRASSPKPGGQNRPTSANNSPKPNSKKPSRRASMASREEMEESSDDDDQGM